MLDVYLDRWLEHCGNAAPRQMIALNDRTRLTDLLIFQNRPKGNDIMIKHMIIWKLKEDVDKEAIAKDIKISLEGLVGKIEGLVEMHILTEKFSSSSGDIMMDSTFESVRALQNYQEHPLHVEIANTKVRPNVDTRLSFDYEV